MGSSLLQLLSRRGRDVIEARATAQLQSAYVCDDGPAILGRNLIAMVGHRAISVADYLENVAGRSGAHAIGIQILRKLEPAPRDHSIPVSNTAVTRTTEDIEAIFTTMENLKIDWHRDRGGEVPIC